MKNKFIFYLLPALAININIHSVDKIDSGNRKIIKYANALYLFSMISSAYYMVKYALIISKFKKKDEEFSDELKKYNEKTLNENIGLSQMNIKRLDLPDDVTYTIRSCLENPESKKEFVKKINLNKLKNINEYDQFIDDNHIKINKTVKCLLSSLLLWDSTRSYLNSVKSKPMSTFKSILRGLEATLGVMISFL